MIRFLSAAEDDVKEVHDWYESRRLGLGETFAIALETLLFRVERAPRARQPLAGIAGKRGVRRARLSGFPWLLLYAVIEGEIVVIGLVHTARRVTHRSRIARRVLDA